MYCPVIQILYYKWQRKNHFKMFVRRFSRQYQPNITNLTQPQVKLYLNTNKNNVCLNGLHCRLIVLSGIGLVIIIICRFTYAFLASIAACRFGHGWFPGYPINVHTQR